MSFFFYFVARAIAPNFANPTSGLLTPYTALVVFGLGVVSSTPLFLPILGRFTHKPADEAITYNDVSSRSHRVGIIGGMIWCLGMTSSLLASGAAGYAISYGLGQGATIIAVLWGGICLARVPEHTALVYSLSYGHGFLLRAGVVINYFSQVRG